MSDARQISFRILGQCLLLVSLVAGISAELSAAQKSSEFTYRWTKNETLVYHVTVEVDQGDYWTILSGHPSYQVMAANEDGLQFRFSGLLNESQKAKPGQRILFRGPGGRSPFSPFTGVAPGGLGRTQPTVIKMNSRGEIISKTGSSQLPFLLGNLSELMLELLPEKDEKTWKKETDISISLSSGRLPRPSIIRDDKKLLRAKQTTTYTLQKPTPTGFEILKEFQLRTIETVDGEPRFEIVGSGTMIFDVDRGRPLELTFEQTVIERENNTTEKTPLKITYRLLNDEEQQKLKESRQVTLDNLSTNKNTKTTQLSDDDRQTLIANLDPAKPQSLGEVMKLQRQQPGEPDSDVAKALVKFLESSNNSRRYAAMKALENWATPDVKPQLLKSLDDSFPIVRHSAMIALARLNDKSTAEPIAQKLESLQDRTPASKALTAMGENSEEAVIDQIDAEDWQTRLAVVKILKEIGTKKSVEPLNKLASDSNGLVKREASLALKAIESRQK